MVGPIWRQGDLLTGTLGSLEGEKVGLGEGRVAHEEGVEDVEGVTHRGTQALGQQHEAPQRVH